MSRFDESGNETYVTYEQALALKRLGFDWDCDTNYTRNGTTQWIMHGRNSKRVLFGTITTCK